MTLEIAGHVQRATLRILPESGGLHVLQVGCLLLTAKQVRTRDVRIREATPEERATLVAQGFLDS